MTAGLYRRSDDAESRLERFRSLTIAHPRLVEAKERLMTALRGAEPNSLIFVFGPTGVGKTTLRLKIEQLIAAEMLSALREDRSRIALSSSRVPTDCLRLLTLWTATRLGPSA